ncbi:MAG: LacI family DNA-binding transcriptional regulator [Sphaerochaetaceae bacterium]|nr:LacI family DNA-binding transcriptional regulator [Sphaerochaetaceae bacterium]
MARLKDIAQKAKVSISTVSRILNHDPSFSISLENRQKVLQIAEEFNYPISEPPKKEGKWKINGTVGLILLYNEIEEVEDPYYLSIRSNFKAECSKLGLPIKEYYYNQDNNILTLEEHSVIVVIGSGSFWTPSLSEYVKKFNKPLIIVDFHHKDEENVDFILINWQQLMENVISFIVEKGFTRIGFIGSRDLDPISKVYFQDDRERYFTKILKDRKLFDKKFLYLSNTTSLNAGYSLANKAISDKNLPEVFFVETDTMAIGVIKALKENEYSVPEDISLISCNDIPEAQYLTPALTTMKIHTQLMGIMAARLASERVLLKRNKGITLHIPSELVIRQSFKNSRG